MRKNKSPEQDIQDEVTDKLVLGGWYVKSTHGNIYQYGFPDLYVAHLRYGARWIEVKNPGKYTFTPAQLENFPRMTAAGVGIWIVTSADQVPELLFKPAQWWTFLDAFKA